MNADLPPDTAPPRFRPVPWTPLSTPQDVDDWIDAHNRSLAEHIGPQETGFGVCFTLTEGGNIYMQTLDDAVVLDVSDGWVVHLLDGTGSREAFARLAELELPVAGSLVGEVARVGVRILVDADRIDLLVPSMVAAHVRERIEIDAAELLR